MVLDYGFRKYFVHVCRCSFTVNHIKSRDQRGKNNIDFVLYRQFKNIIYNREELLL